MFKILAVETRIRIIRLLKGRTLCAGAVAARLDVTRGAVSQHLKVLQGAGLVVAEKRGHYIHYQLNEDTISAWRDAINGLLGWNKQNHDNPIIMDSKNSPNLPLRQRPKRQNDLKKL
ncbi:winged helix-turn-helix transcriptional regulator [bacterium]|nr:winged helix-turn-helix transcriptional regulator [bacterium]